jgi:glycine betaine/proline transport system permease protein
MTLTATNETLAPDTRANRRGAPLSPWRRYAWLVALAVTLILAWYPDLLSWASAYPKDWIVPVQASISTAVNWLLKEASFGLFTFKEFTRAIGSVLDAPMILLKGVFANGFEIDLGSDASILVPPVSWLGVIAIFTVAAFHVGGMRLALITGLSFAYVALIGLWQSTMVTFASIIVAVMIGVALGVLLGVMAWRSAWLDRVLMPLFDFMQTMPVFAYLVPALMLFGYGPSAALVVTLIYAMPPMARVTRTALDQVPGETAEFGTMAGCTQRQMTWRVLLPSARPRLMIGVNQVIMLTLNMVIIASMIGAGGLGYDVWQALKALRIGQGAEAGIAITLLAIVLDRISQSYAAKRPRHDAERRSWFGRHRILVLGLGIALLATMASIWLPLFATVPESITVSTGRFWDGIIAWLNGNLGNTINAIRDAFFIYLLKPVKTAMLSLPWLGVVLFVAALGYRLGGWKLALTTGLLIFFIAMVDLWEEAMISVYLVGVCVFIASTTGILIGIAAARHDAVHRVVQVIIDTLQTLPAFVYLIPVIMLFGVGDFAAMIAITVYAIVPAVRYTDSGIRQVPEHLVEAARAMGCTRFQVLRRVQLPLALPDIMLGINQTLMMGLSMLVITALVGTRDLGQQTLIALSKVDPGRGLTAGICVAFIAISADRMIQTWARHKRTSLGLSHGTVGG